MEQRGVVVIYLSGFGLCDLISRAFRTRPIPFDVSACASGMKSNAALPNGTAFGSDYAVLRVRDFSERCWLA